MSEAEALARRLAVQHVECGENSVHGEALRGVVAAALRQPCEALLQAREALDAMVIRNGREIGYRTMHEIPMEMARKIERKVRAALAAIDALRGGRP